MTTNPVSPERAAVAPSEQPAHQEDSFLRSVLVRSPIWWRQPSSFTVVSLLLVIVCLVLIAFPIIKTWISTVFAGGQFQAKPFADVFGSGIFWTAVGNTAEIVAISGIFAIIAGSVLAWLNVRTDAAIAGVSRILPVMPLLMPGVAMSIGWVFLGDSRVGYLNLVLGKLLSYVGIHTGGQGPINIDSMPGLIFVYSIFLTPLPYLIVTAALQSLDRSLEEASRMSGAGLLRTLVRVTLPSVRSALVACSLLVVVEGFSLYSVPVIIGTRAQINVLSVYTIGLINSYPPLTSQAVVVSFFLVATLGTIWYAGRRVQRATLHATISGRANTSRMRLGIWRYPARILMLLYIASTTVLPLVAIAFVSFQNFWTTRIDFSQFNVGNYDQLWQTPELWASLKNSIQLGIEVATAGMLVAAVIAAYIAYTHSRKGSVIGELIDATLKLPAAVTHIVIGIAFLVVFAAAPFHLYGTIWILVLAYIVVYMPAASTTAMSAASQVSSELTEASWMCGANSLRTFLRVTLPLMRPGLAAGWALVFVSTIGDLTLASMLSGGTNPVVGFEILRLWVDGTFPEIAALAVIITGASLVVVCLALASGRSRARARST